MNKIVKDRKHVKAPPKSTKVSSPPKKTKVVPKKKYVRKFRDKTEVTKV
jgi:hypothetical protein